MTTFTRTALAVAASAAIFPATIAGAADASEVAMYRVTLDSVWSSTTHPTNFPSSAHYSSLIGGSHNDTIAFWQMGQLASPGVKQVAETGGKTNLKNEVNAAIAAGSAHSLIEGFQAPDSPGMTNTTFELTQDHPLATVITMIAPSPDWFVGVSGVQLFQDGQWVNEVVLEMHPYDAGTDSGVSYSSPNNPTSPPQPIFQIGGFPFLNGDGFVAPLGTMTFTRIGAPPCAGDVDGSGGVGFGDILAVVAEWGPCDGCDADTDSNGMVDITDLLTVLAGFGPCP